MKCKRCHEEVDKGDVFCRSCGLRLKKDYSEERIPEPIKLADGRYRGQVMYKRRRELIYGNTLAEYKQNARAFRRGEYDPNPMRSSATLGRIIDDYLAANENVLAETSLRGFGIIRRNRFSDYMDTNVDDIDWQTMINDEAGRVAPKTLSNAWGLICVALQRADVPVPVVNLPKVHVNSHPWLDHKQIKTLLDYVRDKPIELAVILALHSLRLSELTALYVDDVVDEKIHVTKAYVPTKYGDYVMKEGNKTEQSTRTIPVLIPRMMEILPKSGKLVTLNPQNVTKGINRACEACNLPLVGCHGLRRSFASLGYFLGLSERSVMSIGGWSNMHTVHSVYIKLAQEDVNEDILKLRNYYEFTTKDSKNS